MVETSTEIHSSEVVRHTENSCQGALMPIHESWKGSGVEYAANYFVCEKCGKAIRAPVPFQFKPADSLPVPGASSVPFQ